MCPGFEQICGGHKRRRGPYSGWYGGWSVVRWDGGTGRTGVGAGAEADAVVKEIISWVADQAGGCVGESCVGVSVSVCRWVDDSFKFFV